MLYPVNSAVSKSKELLKNMLLNMIVAIENGDISLIKQDDTLIQINIREIIKLSEETESTWI